MQRMPKGNPTKIVIRSTRDISEKKFACDACDRKFFTKKDAKRHMVVHTGNRDFVCSRCPQRFGRKDHLVRHVKKSHNGSLRKPPSMAAVNALGAAVASLLPNNEVTHAVSPKRIANATLKQEPGSYVVMDQVAPTKRVASPGSVMSVAAVHEEGAESVGDGNNLPGLTASAVNVYESNLLPYNAFNLSSEPDMAALSQTVGESQVPLLSPLQSEMDALVGHGSFYAEEEALHKLRMAQFQKVLAEQYSVVSTPASSPISDIQTKLIRQSGGFVIEAASQVGSPATSSDCDGDSVSNDDAGEFRHDVYCPGSMFPNPLTPVDSIALDAELFVKQDDFLTDLIDEVDPDDYVNTVVASQHLAKIPSGQVSPYELVPDNGNNSWNGFESSAYAVSKEQQMLESRLQELLNNNPFCIPADAPSMLTYLCDLAAESIAMDDSQSSCSSDAVSPGSFGSDCCNMAELPLSSVEKELMDFNQLLEQVCQEEAYASPEHVTLAEGNFANDHSENVTAGKPNATFNEPQPCWFPMGHGNTSSWLFATRENQAAEPWFCGRGEMSAEKCFRGCDAGPNELDQMPPWLY